MDSFLVKLNSETAQVPTRGSNQAAGYDLYSDETKVIQPGQWTLVDLGISFTVPEGTYGRIAPRSGMSCKGIMVNAGVVDRDYTGPVKALLVNLNQEPFTINRGDRIAQLILERIVLPEPLVVNSLDSTERGSGGFGSTGK